MATVSLKCQFMSLQQALSLYKPGKSHIVMQGSGELTCDNGKAVVKKFLSRQLFRG